MTALNLALASGADAGVIAAGIYLATILRRAVRVTTAIANAAGPVARRTIWMKAITDDRIHPAALWIVYRIVTAGPDDETDDWPRSRL